MKPRRLPPMPPNQGPMNYPLFEPVASVLDAVKRWKKGERPTSPKNENQRPSS